MKRQFLMLAAAGCLALTSCSSDDDTNGNNNVNADLVGSYKLSSLVTPTSQDYDGDGDSSSNLALEGNCYNDSWISFHSDGTYDESYTSSIIGTGGITLDCDTKVSTGTYTQSGTTVTTTSSTNVSTTYNFNSSAHTIARNASNGAYAAWNSITSLWANLNGNLQFTFTKYTDNDNDGGASANNPDNNNNNTVNADLLGEFKLSNFLVASAQDLDHDGDSSTNLMTEIDCYSSSKIKFNNDGTFEKTTAVSSIGDTGLSLNCTTTTSHGRWTRTGNSVTTTQSNLGVNVTTQYAFNTSAKTLSNSDSNAQYPTFSAVTSLFTNFTGSVTYTFTKNNQ